MANHATDNPAMETEIAELEEAVQRIAELPSTPVAQRMELLQRLERVKQGAIQASDLQSTLRRSPAR